jgi:hypothetical protein
MRTRYERRKPDSEWTLAPRHWTPRQGYATVTLLTELLDQGWQVSNWRAAEDQVCAPIYFVTLAHGDEPLTLSGEQHMTRTFDRQIVEARIKCKAPNLMTQLGVPHSCRAVPVPR